MLLSEHSGAVQAAGHGLCAIRARGTRGGHESISPPHPGRHRPRSRRCHECRSGYCRFEDGAAHLLLPSTGVGARHPQATVGRRLYRRDFVRLGRRPCCGDAVAVSFCVSFLFLFFSLLFLLSFLSLAQALRVPLGLCVGAGVVRRGGRSVCSRSVGGGCVAVVCRGLVCARRSAGCGDSLGGCIFG